jgi:DNA-binding beta-propeller fold protein YncE
MGSGVLRVASCDKNKKKGRAPFLSAICCLLFAACLLPACATIAPSKPRVERYWPLPPDPPRVAYVRSFSQPNDVGRKRTWLLITFRFLFGEREAPYMLRPYAVTTDDRGWVYVTDTGLQTVHIYDFPGKNYDQVFWIERGISRLISPVGVAVDEERNLYVSDSQLNRIFVYETKKFRLVRTIGQPGQFERLGGLAFSPKNKLIYAVDAGAHRIAVFNHDGKEVFSFGKRGEGDGEFNFPSHITIDREGLVYITDSMNFRIQILDEEGKFISKFGRLGNTLGTFSKPKGIAVDSDGHIYVVDGIYDTVQIFDREGRLLMHFGEAGEREGDFWLPNGIVIDRRNRIYVSDTYNQRVQVFQFLGGPGEEEQAPPPLTPAPAQARKP